MKEQSDIKSFLRKLLIAGPAMVTFTKKDGTTREMLCTLKYDLIPEEQRPKTSDDESTGERDYARVFDLERFGWRSVIYDSILTMNPVY